MIVTDSLTFQEYVMREPLPLATIHQTILDFLRSRNDVVFLGAQAVNAYVAEPRMTQDVDILSNRAKELAEELANFLHERFRIAVRVSELQESRGFRIYQIRKEGNRHLADIRQVNEMPAVKLIEDVRVIAPEELISYKVISYHQRRGKPKSGTGWRDLAVLLLTFPNLKTYDGPVLETLKNAGATEEVLATWCELVRQEIRAEDEEDF